MRIEKKILDAVTPSGVAAVSDVNGVELDFWSHTLAREFALTLKTVPNGTGVGASRALTVNGYWSDDRVAIADVPTVLANRKWTSGPLPLVNDGSATSGLRHYKVVEGKRLPIHTITASTTTATATFAEPHGLAVGDLITVAGGAVTGDGAQMRGTFAVASVTSTTVVTYTITSTTGTLLGATVTVARPTRFESQVMLDGFFRPQGRYLYITLDRTALTASSAIAVTLNLVRVPPQTIGGLQI